MAKFRKSRTRMNDDIRRYILRTAKCQSGRKAGVSTSEITDKANSKFKARLSLYQVGAVLGNHGYFNGMTR